MQKGHSGEMKRWSWSQSLEKAIVFGLFFSMAAWADFITSSVWSMLMFQLAWKRKRSLLTYCSFVIMLTDKVPFSPCSPEPLPHCGPWSTLGWSWCPARRQDCVQRSPLPSPELQPSWPPCLQTPGWGGSMRLQNIEERNWWSHAKDYKIVL